MRTHRLCAGGDIARGNGLHDGVVLVRGVVVCAVAGKGQAQAVADGVFQLAGHCHQARVAGQLREQQVEVQIRLCRA